MIDKTRTAQSTNEQLRLTIKPWPCELSEQRQELERQRLRAFELGTLLQETEAKLSVIKADHNMMKREHADAEKKVRNLLTVIINTEYAQQSGSALYKWSETDWSDAPTGTSPMSTSAIFD
jgi:hypothetical protein